MDCADAEAMAEFYSRLLGWEVTYRDHDFVAMQDPAEAPDSRSRRKRGISRRCGRSGPASRPR